MPSLATGPGSDSVVFSQVLAEMCQSGYKDALRFLDDNSESSSASLVVIQVNG